MTEYHECLARVYRLFDEDGMIFLHRVGCDCMALESYDCTCGAKEELTERIADALAAASREADRLVPRTMRGRVMNVIRARLRGEEGA